MRLLLLSISIITSFIVSAENGEWELEKDEDNIKVYTREIENESIREFKAITSIAATRKAIVKVLLDIDNYQNWYPDVTKSEIIKRVSPTTFYAYTVLDLPWPATDRDGVSKISLKKTATATTISMYSAKDIKDKEDGLIRITKSYGFWKLTADGEKTKVHYQYFARPAGSLPDWIINMFIVDNPFTTLKKLRDLVK